MIKNNHDQYRDSKQIDKTIFDLIIRSFSVKIQKLIVKLFNEANYQIEKTHASFRDQQFLTNKNVLFLIELKKPDAMNVDEKASNLTDFFRIDELFSDSSAFTAEPLTRVDRKRRASQRFENETFDSNFKLRSNQSADDAQIVENDENMIDFDDSVVIQKDFQNENDTDYDTNVTMNDDDADSNPDNLKNDDYSKNDINANESSSDEFLFEIVTMMKLKKHYIKFNQKKQKLYSQKNLIFVIF